MNIAVVCNYVLMPDRVGGMDYFFLGFNSYCLSRGHDVKWFFPNLSNHGDYDQLDITNCDNNVERGFIDFSKIHHVKFDRIITHFTAICTPFYKKAKQSYPLSSIVAVDHNPRPVGGYPFKKRLEKKLQSTLYARYIDVFVGVSQYTVDELIKDFGKRISDRCELVYNGIVTQHIEISEKRSLDIQNLRFLTVAHLRESKGIQDLLAALGALKKKDVLGSTQFDLYGDGPYRSSLETLSREADLGNNVNFMGSVSDVNTRFPDYDYMILPTYMECFSLAILESLAANVPVITTTVGGNMEAVIDGDNGYIYKEGNVNELEVIVEELLTGRRSIDRNFYKYVRDTWSIESMISNHYKLLKCI